MAGQVCKKCYPTSYIKSKNLGKACALITDGRFSGGTSGLSIGHVHLRLVLAALSDWSSRAILSVLIFPIAQLMYWF